MKLIGAVTTFIAAGLLMGASSDVVAENYDNYPLGLCVGCNSDSQYGAAARALMPRNYNGTMSYVMVNPENGNSRLVEVTQTPPGQVPRSVELSEAGRKPPTHLRRGQPVSMGYGGTDAVFVEDLDVGVMSNHTYAGALSPEATNQIRSIVAISKDTVYYALPVGHGYASFNQREPAMIANANLAAATAAHPGWAAGGLGSRIWGSLVSRLKSHGQTIRVCPIYNNGDISCHSPNPHTPSLEHYLEGSAVNSSGQPVNSGGGGGGGGDRPVVDGGTWAPNIGYGAPGSTGGRGELWLFCGSVGGVIQYCYTQIL